MSSSFDASTITLKTWNQLERATHLFFQEQE
jgi:hypothetical protein